MSIATELGKLNTQRNNLAANLTTKGVTASPTETLAQLVPKVLTISGGHSIPQLPNLTGLRCHLDATDESSVTKDVDNRISEWRDISGLSNHATATGDAMPTFVSNGISGKPSISFAAGAEKFSFAGVNSTTYTYFIVMKAAYPSSNTMFFRSYCMALGFFPTGRIMEGTNYTGGKSQVPFINNYYSNTDTNIFTVQRALPMRTAMSINARPIPIQDTSTASWWATGDPYIGGVIGDIAEFLVYDRLLNGIEINKVENYLMYKYGLGT